MHRGFAKLYRKFVEWEWYTDIPCKTLYVHCLLCAGHTDRKYRGKDVPKGSFFTGREHLSSKTGLTSQQIRTALRKLCPEYLTSVATSKGTHIFVVDFDTYNDKGDANNQHINQVSTNEQPTNNQRTTNEQPTNNQRTTNEQPTDNH